MTTAYRYIVGNQTIETLNVSSIPINVDYEEFEFTPPEEVIDNSYLYNQIEQMQQELLTRWDVMASKKKCYEDSIDLGLTPNCNFIEDVYKQIIVWAWYVRGQNDGVSSTSSETDLQERIDNLNNLNSWYPYINQEDYYLDELGLRG